MSKNNLKFLILAGLVVAFVATLTALPAQSRPGLGVTNFDSVHLRDSGPTAQPVLRADQRGTGKIVEFMDAGTPVWSILDGGSITQSGLQSLTGGQVVSPNLVVDAPVALGTATPALMVINPSSSNPNAVVIKGNVTATPYFSINPTSAVIMNNALQSSAVGQKQFCATNTITDTASYAVGTTAIATPVYTWCTLGTISGDASRCAATHATGLITVTVRNSNATPAANAAGAAVTWCVVGNP